MFAPLDPAHRRLAHGLVDSVSSALEAAVDLTDAELRSLARSEFSPTGVDLTAGDYRPQSASRLQLAPGERTPVHMPAVEALGIPGFWLVPLYGATSLRALMWVFDGSIHRDSIAYATEAAAATILALDRAGAFDVAPMPHVVDLPSLFASSSEYVEDALAGHLDGRRVALDGPVGALAIAVDAEDGYSSTDSAALTLRRAVTRAVAGVPADRRVLAQSGTEALLVLSVPAQGGATLERVSAVVQDFLLRHPVDVPSDRWTIGTSEIVRYPDRPGRAAWQAVRAARLGLRLGRTGRSVEWRDASRYHGVYAIPGEVLKDHFLTVDREDFFDDPKNQDLVATLESFLEHAGNVQAVAAERFVHRTNVYHRIRRVEAELGVDLSDGHDRLELHMALMAWRLRTPHRTGPQAGAGPTRRIRGEHA